jgi:hypothetical protein
MPKRLSPAQRVALLQECQAQVERTQGALSGFFFLESIPPGTTYVLMASKLLELARMALQSAEFAQTRQR